MKVFITGGSGFVGQFLIEDLRQKGHEVFALARSQSSQDKVRQKGATPIAGDLGEAKSYQAQLKGMDAVIHVAAMIEMWGDYDLFYQINVVGTRNLVQASEAVGVKRFIYISAAAVVADGNPLEDIDENYQPSRLPVDNYSKTKALAEEEVLQSQGSMSRIVLRPPMIWGPDMRMIEEFRETIEKNGFPTIGERDHTLATIHVQNLLEVIHQALLQPETKGVYFVTDGEKRPLRLFMKALGQGYGLDTGDRSVPRFLALNMARIMEFVWRSFRLKGHPPMTRSMVYLMGTEFSIDDSKARRELKYQNRISMDEGLAKLIQS